MDAQVLMTSGDAISQHLVEHKQKHDVRRLSLLRVLLHILSHARSWPVETDTEGMHCSSSCSRPADANALLAQFIA